MVFLGRTFTVFPVYSFRFLRSFVFPVMKYGLYVPLIAIIKVAASTKYMLFS